MMSTVKLLIPLTKVAKDWMKKNINCESWQRIGGGIGIETRFIGDIVEALSNAGLKIEKDFSVQS